MKVLKNSKKTICGVGFPLFTVIKNQETNKYCYYVNYLWSKKVADRMIYKNSKKSFLLNKILMNLLGLIWTIISLITIPILLILAPFYMYYDGCKHFVTDSFLVNNVRFFNWCNIVFVVILSVWLVFK